MKNIILLIMLCSSAVYTQRILTLDESIKIALKQSYSIRSSNQNLLSSINTLESARRGLLSRIDLSVDVPNYYRSLQPQFNSATGMLEYYKVGETRFQSDLSITQPLIFSNGTISLVGSLFQRDQLNQKGELVRDYFTNMAVQLRQPLFVANTQKISLNKAELNLEKTQFSFTRTQFEIVYGVTQAFYYLFEATKEVEIAEINVKQREEAYNTAVARFKAGLLPEVEMLRLEVELMSGKNELMSKKVNMEELQNSFKAGIGLPLEEKINVNPALDYKSAEIDSTKAVELALKNNVEIKNSIIDVELQKFNVDEESSKRSFRADIIANYGLNKNEAEFKNLPKNLLETKSVVLTLSLPVWDWGSHARAVEAAEANLRSAELTQTDREVQTKKDIINLLNKIRVAKSRLEVVQRGEEVAQKNYDISLLRFNTGQIKSDELVLEQKRLTNAKLENLSALIEYKNAIADLKRKTFFDFENNMPVIINN